MAQTRITHDEVARLFGDISDQRIADILATGATHDDLEQVAAWLAQEDDVMGELERPLTGIAAQVYEIVASDLRLLDEDNARP